MRGLQGAYLQAPVFLGFFTCWHIPFTFHSILKKKKKKIRDGPSETSLQEIPLE